MQQVVASNLVAVLRGLCVLSSKSLSLEAGEIATVERNITYCLEVLTERLGVPEPSLGGDQPRDGREL